MASQGEREFRHGCARGHDIVQDRNVSVLTELMRSTHTEGAAQVFLSLTSGDELFLRGGSLLSIDTVAKIADLQTAADDLAHFKSLVVSALTQSCRMQGYGQHCARPGVDFTRRGIK